MNENIKISKNYIENISHKMDEIAAGYLGEWWNRDKQLLRKEYSNFFNSDKTVPIVSNFTFTTPRIEYSPDIPVAADLPDDDGRPTLVERLDKAEEKVRDLANRLFKTEAAYNQAIWEAERVAKRIGVLHEQIHRAEAMAQKVDAMGADLEKCRRAMGTIAFEKVLADEA